MKVVSQLIYVKGPHTTKKIAYQRDESGITAHLEGPHTTKKLLMRYTWGGPHPPLTPTPRNHSLNCRATPKPLQST